jgi:hypothetical protein
MFEKHFLRSFLKHMLHAVLNQFESFFWRCVHIFAEIEAVEHALHNFHFGHKGFLRFLNLGNTVLVTAGIGIERFLQILAQSDIINNQAGFLVLINSIDPGNGLHQVMFFHDFVDVHGVQAGNIESSQPHINMI